VSSLAAMLAVVAHDAGVTPDDLVTVVTEHVTIHAAAVSSVMTLVALRKTRSMSRIR